MSCLGGRLFEPLQPALQGFIAAIGLAARAPSRFEVRACLFEASGVFANLSRFRGQQRVAARLCRACVENMTGQYAAIRCAATPGRLMRGGLRAQSCKSALGFAQPIERLIGLAFSLNEGLRGSAHSYDR